MSNQRFEFHTDNGKVFKVRVLKNFPKSMRVQLIRDDGSIEQDNFRIKRSNKRLIEIKKEI